MNVSLPPEIDVPEELPSWTDFAQAKQEDKNWANEEELRGVLHRNDVRWHKSYGLVVVVLMWFFVALFVWTLVVLSIHYLTSWSFLTDAQLSRIQSIVFSGTVGSVVTGMLQRRINKTN